MVIFRGVKHISVLGAGTAGWLAALYLRKIFSPNVKITVISSEEIPIVGVGEGGVLNFSAALDKFNIPLMEFIQETGAVHKLGFAYEGWRTSNKDKQDVYYHMFPKFDPALFWDENGYIPQLSLLMNHQIPVSFIVDSIKFREQNISQETITEYVKNRNKQNFLSSFHFDTYKVGQYFKKVALKMGVQHHEGRYQYSKLDAETGNITALVVDDHEIATDFVIDASGFHRQLVSKVFQSQWISFKDYLPANSAIPFHLKHKTAHPDLVTCATAMDHGWVWQIPLQERIGAGYVFDQNFTSVDKAVDEVEKWLGHSIEPIRTIQFEAGYYEKNWNKNCLAIGLASGFVEPLEATSIGQTIVQIESFLDVITQSHGVITDNAIQQYNMENAYGWNGIRDFVRMHYDTQRTDTPFWKNISELKVSDQYKEFKELWKLRTPRAIDFKQYQMGNSQIFGIYSWCAIAQALGLIQPNAAITELSALSPDKKKKLIQYLDFIKQKLAI